MSQVFSADSVNLLTPATVTTTTETTAVTGNFLSPPFQNAKAIVEATFALTVGATANILTVRIRRNPAAENVVIASAQTQTFTAGTVTMVSLQGADAPIGPGPVQYALTVQQGAATGNGNITQANITTMLISG